VTARAFPGLPGVRQEAAASFGECAPEARAVNVAGLAPIRYCPSASQTGGLTGGHHAAGYPIRGVGVVVAAEAAARQQQPVYVAWDQAAEGDLGGLHLDAVGRGGVVAGGDAAVDVDAEADRADGVVEPATGGQVVAGQVVLARDSPTLAQAEAGGGGTAARTPSPSPRAQPVASRRVPRCSGVATRGWGRSRT